MKKLVISSILILLLATTARANQEGDWHGHWDGKSSIAYDVTTIKPEIKTRLSIDPDVKVEYIIIHSIKLFAAANGDGHVIMDLEIVDYKGNHTFKTCEKRLEGGHGYFFEVVTEDMKVKGKIN